MPSTKQASRSKKLRRVASKLFPHTYYTVRKRRSAAEAAQTRVALLEAALESFGKVGWKASTFENVAERAGVTRGALHHHFRDKRALLVEALDWGWSEYGSRLFSTEQTQSSGQDFLVSLFRTFIVLLRSDEQFRSLVSTTVLAAPQAFDTPEAKFDALNSWRKDIINALEYEEQGSLDADEIAGLVIVILQGLTLSAVTRPRDLPEHADIDAAALALTKGLLS